MKKETVGKISSDLIIKEPETRSPVEQMREQLSEYDQNIYKCVNHGITLYKNDFYIVVLTKKERLMPNVLRNYFLHRSSCPTPEWDQTVYKYHAKDQKIEFLWVVPAKDVCEYLQRNALLVENEEKGLLNYVIAYHDGSLFKKCKQLNGELDLATPFITQ